jgi:hypothetical protein
MINVPAGYRQVGLVDGGPLVNQNEIGLAVSHHAINEIGRAF